MASESEIVAAWERALGEGLPPMHALSHAMDALGIVDRAERDSVIDSGLFTGWPPHLAREVVS